MANHLTEDDEELLERYKLYKTDHIVHCSQKNPKILYSSFTIEEIMRLSLLIKQDEKCNRHPLKNTTLKMGDWNIHVYNPETQNEEIIRVSLFKETMIQEIPVKEPWYIYKIVHMR